MAIATPVKRGTTVYVYDEKHRQLLVLGVVSNPEAGLTGYTSTTVSVRRGNAIYTYDENGRQLGITSARWRQRGGQYGYTSAEPVPWGIGMRP